MMKYFTAFFRYKNIKILVLNLGSLPKRAKNLQNLISYFLTFLYRQIISQTIRLKVIWFSHVFSLQLFLSDFSSHSIAHQSRNDSIGLVK